jgi:hypothetical protein
MVRPFISSAVRIVVDAAKSDEIKACGRDSVRLLGKLSLQRKVESSLLEAGVVNPHLFVSVENSNTVRLYGMVNSSEEKEAVERVVKGIKDTKKIANDLVVFKGSMGAWKKLIGRQTPLEDLWPSNGKTHTGH